MSNPEVAMTLDEAVAEVLGTLTGLDLEYEPEQDRYRAITRQLNKALRANALENEWSCYASTESVGTAAEGEDGAFVRRSVRVRIINDDAVRLVNADGKPLRWAYILPKDALHKYSWKRKLWCSVIGSRLQFSRAFTAAEDGLDIQVPVMREPAMFRLPEAGAAVPDAIRNQEVDFAYPDVVIARAAYYVAQSDPVMQPRVQTLEMDYKALMYQLIERDTAHTDTPYMNDFLLPLDNGLIHDDAPHLHPGSDY